MAGSPTVQCKTDYNLCYKNHVCIITSNVIVVVFLFCCTWCEVRLRQHEALVRTAK